jgi:3D (Asp-Asp-Asp) domain-containing protein
VGRGRRRRGVHLAALSAGVAALAIGLGTGGSSAHASAASRGYKLTVDAVAYHLRGRTASGLPCAKGAVAVDPRLISLGTQMYVPGYGPGVAADVGTAVKGRIIDLWMSTDAAARKWGRRNVTITVYADSSAR